MRKVYFTLLLLAMTAVGASAYDFEVDGIYYNILNNSEVAVAGENEYNEDDYDYAPGSYSGDIEIPETVDFEGITYYVTAIGNYAFRASEDLTSVYIPSTVTSIGEEAFNGCINLEYVNIPPGVTRLNKRVFWCCFALGYIEIPYGVTYIGEEALADCHGLTYISIPSSVITIDEGAFHTCYNLTSVSIGESVETIGSYAFYSCPVLEDIYIPYSVKSVGSAAFEGTPWYENQPDGLVYAGSVAYKYKGEMPENTQITLEEGTLGITSYAFYGQSNLISIDIPNTVTNIGDYTFDECENMDVIICKAATPPDALFSYAYVVPQFVYRVTLFVPQASLEAYRSHDEWGKFDRMMPYRGSEPIEVDGVYYTIISGNKVAVASINHDYNRDVTIPETIRYYNVTCPVTAIGAHAFSNRTAMTGVNLSESITSIGDWAFSSCVALTHMTIPGSVTTIGERAFSWCSGLTDVDIPNTIKTLGDYIFYSCVNLTSIQLPDSLTGIPNGAFSNCKGLTEVDIPGSVTFIGEDAFSWCTALTSVVIPNSVTSMGLRSFYGCSHLQSVDIPNSVTSIGNVPFSGCSQLTSITSRALVPPEVVRVFSNYNESSRYEQVTLFVPYESLEAYRAHEEWGQFTHIVPFVGAGPGDVDADGNIGINDVTTLIDQLLSSDEQPEWMDVNGDGIVGIADVTHIIDMILNAN